MEEMEKKWMEHNVIPRLSSVGVEEVCRVMMDDTK